MHVYMYTCTHVYMYAGENGPERRGMLAEEGPGKLRPNLRQTVRSPDCETQTRAGANVGNNTIEEENV